MRQAILALTCFLILSWTHAEAAEGWWVGGGIGPRFSGLIEDVGVPVAPGNTRELSRSTLIGAGAFCAYDVSQTIVLEGALMYNQRGFDLSTTGQGVQRDQQNVWSYLDLQLGANWYPFTSLVNWHPFVGVSAQPGVFLGGTEKTVTSGDNDQIKENALGSGDIETFHFAVTPRIGADFQVGALRIGVIVSYEYGVTDTQYRGVSSTVDVIAANLRLMVPLGSSSNDD